jgi:hypothetical protein
MMRKFQTKTFRAVKISQNWSLHVFLSMRKARYSAYKTCLLLVFCITSELYADNPAVTVEE